jgi:hypothetical protein
LFELDAATNDRLLYLADVSAAVHDLRRGRMFQSCLDAASYEASQALAERLLDSGSLGVVYPSVRHRGGTYVALFRPALVGNVRRDRAWRFIWDGSPRPAITAESSSG